MGSSVRNPFNFFSPFKNLTCISSFRKQPGPPQYWTEFHPLQTGLFSDCSLTCLKSHWKENLEPYSESSDYKNHTRIHFQEFEFIINKKNKFLFLPWFEMGKDGSGLRWARFLELLRRRTVFKCWHGRIRWEWGFLFTATTGQDWSKGLMSLRKIIKPMR